MSPNQTPGIKGMLCLVFILLIVNTISAQWNWITPFPNGYYLNDVSSPDGQNYWIVGERGTLMHLVDGEFTIYPLMEQADLNSIAFFSNTLGWIVGDSGRIYQFDGQHWIGQLSPTSQHLYSITVAGENSVYASGQEGVVLQYTNGQWQTINAPYTILPLLSISALNDEFITAVGSDFISSVFEIRIDNVWTQQFFTDGTQAMSVFEENINNGWIGGKYENPFNFAGIWHRSSQSGNYELEFSHYCMDFDQYNYISDLYMSDEDNGWAVEPYGGYTEPQNPTSLPPSFVIHRYLNNSWNTSYTAEGWELSHVYSHEPGHCIAVGAGGQILEYYNNSWNHHSSFMSGFLYDVFLIDENTGWAVGKNGAVRRLQDGNWTVYPKFTDLDLWSVFFFDENDGWAVGGTTEYTPGAAGVVYKYHDGNWTQSAWLDECLFSVSFSNPSQGFAVGNNGKIMKFDGANWISISSPTSVPLRSIDLVNESFGFVVGDYGTLIWFNGSSFIPHQIPTDKDLRSVSFSSTSNGWIVGQQGTVFRFQNNTWIQYPVLGGILADVKTISDSMAIIVGYHSMSIFDGTNWIPFIDDDFRLTDNTYLNAVDFMDDSVGTVVGGVNAGAFQFPNSYLAHSLIINTNCGGIYTGFKEADPTISQASRVVKAFPNPCSNKLLLDFSLTEADRITISLLDLQGRLIKVIVPEKSYEPGNHTVEFDISYLHSGLYLVETKSKRLRDISRVVKI